MVIRKTDKTDFDDVFRIHKQAFRTEEEAELTIALLSDPSAVPVVSLIAFEDDVPAGHILFSSVSIEKAPPGASAFILAPLAVIPEMQNRGIGGKLIKSGISGLEEAGAMLVFVLGHPAYYPKFGFGAAGRHGFEMPYPFISRQSEAWMVQELKIGGLDSCGGKVLCADALMKEEYWR